MTAPKTRKRRSKLSEAGDAARRAIMRSLLIEALIVCKWNLTTTATHLGMSGAGDVSRAIIDLELTPLVDLAREAKLVSRRTRAEK